MQEEKKLDNPVWFSLQETHQDFALIYNDIRFYDPIYCPFGAGLQTANKISDSMKQYGKLCDDFYVVGGDTPQIPESLRIKNELICQQMVLYQGIEIDIVEEIIPLKSQHYPDLVGLVNLVQPGYFKENTPRLGNYYGIFKDGVLAAVTGERMNMKSYTEISAVVTHPLHTRNGYAKQLIAHASQEIFKRNKTPFLHVADSNRSAIKLYERLGFVHRRNMHFWHIGL